VADTKPLPPVNRVQLNKPKRVVPPRQSVSEKKPAERKKQRQEALPAHWNIPPTESESIKQTAMLDPIQAEFRAAMAGVQPLPPPNLVVHGTRPPPPRPPHHRANTQAPRPESPHGNIALQDRLEGGDEPHYLRNGLAQNVLRDLRRGRWVIQDEIDLHGLNRDEARHLLASFLAECLHHGKRCVRVVHGKGLGSPQKTSILRQLVRGWLAQRQEVLAYCQAKPPDGGEGALIVLLRNQK